MVRLYIWTLLVVVAEGVTAVQAWGARTAVDAVQAALGQALVARTDESITALQDAGDRLTAYASTPVLVVAIVTLLALVGWLHSAAVLVHRNRLGTLRHSPGWAIGAWFIPILNVIWVPAIAVDVFRAGRTRPPAGLVVGLWQLLWIGELVVARVAIGALNVASTPEGVQSAMSLVGLGVGLWIASSVMAVAMVALTTCGLASTMRLTVSTHELEQPSTGGYPSGFWGTAPQDDAGAAPVPDGRFGVPAYDPPAAPRATAVGPPEPWLSAPTPPPPAVQPVASWAPEPEPARPEPVPAEPGSPYPSGGVFYPQ